MGQIIRNGEVYGGGNSSDISYGDGTVEDEINTLKTGLQNVSVFKLATGSKSWGSYSDISEYVDDELSSGQCAVCYSASNSIPYDYGLYLCFKVTAATAFVLCIQGVVSSTQRIYFRGKGGSNGTWIDWRQIL